MAIASGPSTITNGLILELDPANSKSYSGSGNTIYNLATTSNNGLVENGAVYTSQLSGYFNFDGTNDRISVAHDSSINFTDNFTVSFWGRMKTNALQVPLSKYNGGVRGWVFAFSNNVMAFDGRNQTADGYKSAGSAVTTYLGDWNHYTGVKSGVNMYIYQNGASTGSTVWSSAGDMTSTVDLTVASNNSAYYSPCDIGQVLLYNRALTDSEIKQNFDASKNKYIYASPIITDNLVLNLDAGTYLSYDSGVSWYDASEKTSYIFTLRNSPTFVNAGLASYFTLNGSNQDFYLASYGPAYTQITINLWVWRNGAQNAYTGLVMSRGNATGFTYQTAGASLGYHWINDGNTYTYSSGVDTTNQTWVMATLVVSPIDAKWYLNGVLQNARTYSHSSSTFSNLYIGSDSGSVGRYYNGRIAMCQIYNRALTSTEILQNFNATRGRYGV
jgi:hypothetical protein